MILTRGYGYESILSEEGAVINIDFDSSDIEIDIDIDDNEIEVDIDTDEITVEDV